MNQSDARAVWTVKGYVGEYRLCWKTKHDAVRHTRRDGKPGPKMYFTSKIEAELVAWRKKHELEQPVMVRSGDKLSAVRTAAELVFKPKPVIVERRRAMA